ncbi:GGDEF domain-containing protein [Petrachloros mirabilis]
MLKAIRISLSLFFVPEGLIFFASLSFLRPQGLPLWLNPPVTALPYVVLAFGLIFSWYFSSTRIFFSLLVLLLADRSLLLFPVTGNESTTLHFTIFAITAFLLPLNLLAFSILKHHPVSSTRGILRLLPVLLQPFLVLWLSYPEQKHLAEAFQATYLDWLPTGWTPIPQPALWAFLLAIIMHVVRFSVYRDPLDRGAAWALGMVFTAYHCTRFDWQATNFFSSAGLILFVALVLSNYRRTYRDELTGIENRMAYEEAIAQLGRRFSVAVLSIDQLKRYANVHGRAVADQILMLVSPKILAACNSARVFRAGGEDLTLLFRGRSSLEALAALDYARKLVEGASFFLRGRNRVWESATRTSHREDKDQELAVTVSIGVAETSAEMTTFDQVLKSAYRALYDAKTSGGNSVKRMVGPTVSRQPSRRNLAGTRAYGERY